MRARASHELHPPEEVAAAARLEQARALPRGRRVARRLLLLGCAALLALVSLLSIAVGSREIDPIDVVRVLLTPDGAWDDADVNGLRLPRTLLGVAVGAALGLSGALMQGLTRNPLADPGLLGVSAGAAFGVVLATGVLGISSPYGYVWFAFAGALIAAMSVHAIGSYGRGGPTPARLVLAGAAVSAFLGSLTSAVVLTDAYALNTFRFWSAGSLTGQDGRVLGEVLPFLLAGAALAMAGASALNALALGDDVARALGNRVGLVRWRAAAAIVLLAGGAVAVSGPVVFVGLVVPHIARAVTGPDHRWLLPCSAVLGPCLLLGADVVGRVVARPAEIQAGVVVAFVGVPFFLAVARRSRIVAL